MLLNYASYANIMPIMLYAPAMLLCQFLCWHNPLEPSWGTQPKYVVPPIYRDFNNFSKFCGIAVSLEV
eukprot:COSAG02_NODE_7877_length_2807_cov_2.148080_3_plen_68_part_00